MWVRLDKEEIDLILSLIPAGPLADKLRKEPDPDAAAFIAAVDTDDDFEVDEDAIVSRGEDDGAFVMSWVWVTNEAAGIPSEDLDDDEEAGWPLKI